MVTGVGGSSLLSGGKISAFPAGRRMATVLGDETKTRDSLKDSLQVFQQFVPMIAPRFSDDARGKAESSFLERGFDFRYYDSYLYRQRDLVAGCSRMISEIRDMGVTVKLHTRVSQIRGAEEGFRVSAEDTNESFEILSRRIIFATGRWGIDLLNSVASSTGLSRMSNDCDVGVRLEFPTAEWSDIDSCHNDLKLHFGNARTFCVCKDGFIAPYRMNDFFIIEGTADPDICTGFTNLAIMVRHHADGIEDERDILADVRRKMIDQSHGIPVRQRLIDYLSNTVQHEAGFKSRASMNYWKWGNVNACLPEHIAPTIRNAVEYFCQRLMSPESHSMVSVFAPGLDFFWPRFSVKKGFLSNVDGIYIIGDAYGGFRGILQAFCSGIESAKSVLGDNQIVPQLA
jgi:uncharacterized FAD-dependent dehydrogenase